MPFFLEDQSTPSNLSQYKEKNHYSNNTADFHEAVKNWSGDSSNKSYLERANKGIQSLLNVSSTSLSE